MPNHILLAEEIHQDNIKVGWWKQQHEFQNGTGPLITQPRNIGELICLMHSELSEAYEGFKMDIADDHLPHHRMFDVELADTCIRIYDTLGYYALPFDIDLRTTLYDGTSTYQMLLEAHFSLSNAMEGFRKGSDSRGVENLAYALRKIWLIARINNIPLEQLIEEKREYNRNRADHKPENRVKEGGKQF